MRLHFPSDLLYVDANKVVCIHRWWYAAQRCSELDVFHQRVTLELYRRQELLAYKADLASGVPTSQR
jgi:hypothetical protein